jgi:peptide/nickel transport system permease protein
VLALFRTTKGAIGFALIAFLVVIGLGAEFFAPHDPLAQDLRARLTPPGFENATGGGTYLFGTDPVGRDVLSRMIYGARVSLIVGLCAVLISGTVGILLGLLTGFYRGWLDSIVMRIVDMQLAMPLIVFAIAWMGFFGAGLWSVVLVIGIWGWVQYTRFTRSMVLSIKETQFVQASRALGAGNATIIFQHIAPNLIGPVIVMATLQVGHAVLLESTLSFLGVGVTPPTPTWGGMVSEGRSYVDTAWWIVVLPGFAITLFVLGANFLGDAMRDILDPKTR